MKLQSSYNANVSDKQIQNKNYRNGGYLGNVMEKKENVESSEQIKVILEFPKLMEHKPASTDRDLQEIKSMLFNILKDYVRTISWRENYLVFIKWEWNVSFPLSTYNEKEYYYAEEIKIKDSFKSKF